MSRSFLKPFFTLILAMFGTSLFGGPFTITGDSADSLSIHYNGSPLVTSILSSVTPTASSEKRRYSRVERSDGTTIFNVWSEDLESRFRTEIAIDAEGSQVELTFISEAPAFHPHTRHPKTVKLQLPFARFQNATFEGYAGRATAENRKNGILKADTPKGSLLGTGWRFIAFQKGEDNLVFDFNPIGPGDFISIYNMGAIRGNWTVARNGAYLEMIGGSTLPEIGGMTGAKLRIMEGGGKQKHARALATLIRMDGRNGVAVCPMVGFQISVPRSDQKPSSRCNNFHR